MINQSIHDFLVNQREIDLEVGYDKTKLIWNQIPIANYYLLWMIFVEILLVVTSVYCNIDYTYSEGLKYHVIGIFLFCVVFMTGWSGYGLKHLYISKIVWVILLCVCIELIVCTISILYQSIEFLFYGSLALVIFTVICEALVNKTMFSIFIGFTIIIPPLQILAQRILSVGSFIYVFIILFLTLILLISKTKNSIQNQGPLHRICLLCFYAVWCLEFLFSLSCMLSQQHISWLWYSIFNHLLFIFSIGYYVKVLPSFSSLIKSANKPRLYQVSETLLCRQEDFIHEPRRSIIGKPLSQCICCLSEDSIFCYESCNHACLGKECAADWLAKSMKSCPICRTNSNLLYQLSRVDGFSFQIQRIYKFR